MAVKTGTRIKVISGSIHARIFIVIIVAAVVINISGLAAGGWFLTHSISGAMQDDLLVAVDIADQYVTKEIDLLKIKAAEAAENIDMLLKAGESEGFLENVCAEYPMYTGLAVFNRTSMLDSWSEFPVTPDLYREPFMQTAILGGQAVSNTMYAADGSLVMYVSAPISGDLTLAAVLPGMYFADLLSQFKFWQTGHLFINDRDGYVVANIRPEWVQRRYNFLQMAEKNSVYNDLAVMTRRGINGERGIARYSVSGVPRLCAFRPVSSKTENWFVGIVAPTSETALKTIPKSILLMSMITLILSIAAAFAAASILRRPYEEANRLRKAAEAVSLSKSTFLANMSHEIRTPMNSILGFAELAMDGELTHKARDYLAKIRSNAEWLLQIINDILDISKVESGRMELENIPFDMHELFSSCRTLIMPKAVEKGITLYFYVEPSIGKKPLGDPTRLRQVLVNLLSNAVKFTNTGMVKLHAALKEMREKTLTMYFEIKDSGIGMTREQIEKIFDPFTQAESGTTRKYGGTGLGLSITKNIVEMMGGELSVESTPGVGSKFSFELTFDTIDVSDEDANSKKIIFNTLEKPEFEGEILLCEDNTMNQQIICEHLARVGLKTVVAENGKIGVDMVMERKEKDKKQFDLIFMDMHMPVMDGLEASKKILDLNTGVPIVAMTANIMANDREVYSMSGMHDCVGKPFTSQELWCCLMKYLKPLSIDAVHKEARLETDAEFMKKLQLHFVRANKNKFAEITQALEENDLKLAYRLVHTLKSNAGQIGKTLLQRTAADIERQLKEGAVMVTGEQLSSLENELTMVINELSPLLEEAREEGYDAAEHTHLDPEKIVELFDKLEDLLKRGSPECTKLMNDLRSIPGSGLLVQQIDDFEFTDAISTLKELKERMGKNDGK